MPAGRPWYQRNPADFIMAVRGFELEVVGAYSLIIDHLNDRDRPLPNDDKFMAGLLHCSTKKWRKIRDELIAANKIYITPDDYITNPRFEREHAKRFKAHGEAVEAGRAGGFASAAKRAGQSELDFEPETPPRAREQARIRHARTEEPEVLQKMGQNFSKTSASSLAEPKTKTQQNQRSASTPPSSSARARQSSELREVRDSSQLSDSTPRDPADLKALYDAVLDAAGVRLTDPTAIDRAMATVDGWRDEGFDFDTVVLPTIRAETLKADRPTRVLSRFNAQLRLEHAKRKHAAKNGKAYHPPQIPKLNPDGEDPSFFALRTELLERCGASAYCLAFNDIRFEAVNDLGDQRQPLRISGPGHLVERLRQSGDYKRILHAAAREAGFNEVWHK